MHNSDEPIFVRNPKNIDRRRVLTGLGAMLALAGCNSVTDDFSQNGNSAGNPLAAGGNPNNGANPNNPNLPQGGAGGGIQLTGNVNRTEIGGENLNVQTVQQFSGPVDPNGSFSTRVQGQNPQIGFVTEATGNLNRAGEGIMSGPLRALFLYLPNRALDIGAQSTALAFCFLTVGVLTPDPREAGQRIDVLLSRPSFPALVSFFRNELPRKTIVELLEGGNQLHNLREQVLTEYREAQSTNRSLTLDEWIQQGGMQWEALPTRSPDGLPQSGYQFSNEGFRFVSIVREEVDAAGNQTTPPVATTLTTAVRIPFSSSQIMSGGNGVSYGTLATGQATTPGNADDKFTPKRNTAKINYYVHGLGLGAASTVKNNLPAGIELSDFGIMHLVHTNFFYYAMPLLDIFSGGLAGLAVFKLLLPGALSPAGTALIHEVEHLAGQTAVPGAVGSLLTSLGTATTESVANVVSDFINLTVALLSAGAESATFAAAVVSVAEAAGYTVTAATVTTAASFIAAVFGVIGGLFGLFNLGRAFKDTLRLPEVVKLEVDRLRLESLDFAPTVFAHVNHNGDVVYSRNVEDPVAPSVQTRLHRLDRDVHTSAEELVLLDQPNSTNPLFIRAGSDVGDLIGVRYTEVGQQALIYNYLNNQSTVFGPASTTTVYTPIASNTNGDIVGEVVISRENPNPGPGLPAVINEAAWFVSRGGATPSLLKLRESIFAALPKKPEDATAFTDFRPLAISDELEIMGSFLIAFRLAGVFVYNVNRNEVEFIHFNQEHLFGGSDARYPAGHFSSGETRWRVFTRRDDGGGFSSFRQTKGNTTSNDGMGGFASGIADDGTVGGYNFIDGASQAFILHPDRRVENLHTKLIEFAPGQIVDATKRHTRIVAVGRKGHMAALVRHEGDNLLQQFGVGLAPGKPSSNP